MKNRLFLIVSLFLVLAACQNSETQNTSTEENPVEVEEPQRDFMAEGKTIAKQSFETLSGELKQALERGGFEEAIGYCNVEAMPLTDSLAKHYQVEIKRATSKPRNPANVANEDELAILAIWEEKQQNAEELKPTLFESDSEVHFYAPITMKPLCLNCHGVPNNTMPAENAAILADKYPADQATGYELDELRGLWHITFNK